MRAYIKEIVAKQVDKLFHAPDAETVLSWWIANEGRRPVVVVGAGFTRNAVIDATGMPVASEHVPLWADISRRFAEDLRIDDASGIDALTLAELHRDGLGDRRFYDLLLDMLKDNELAPGKAHEALFNFDAEAIVTTNFLDTLLDRDQRRCVPIVEDIDVARRLDRFLQGQTQQIEVLYLHGHRSHPGSWVLSRSQYEELPATRPVLLARVRQLLSQHPVLTVGFSLTDPDFHQVYRQLSLDMKTKHPVGLALLGPCSDTERRSEQESAQRRHWEKLGMRIARFKDWKNLGEKFADFFGTLNRITIQGLKECMPHRRSFVSRVEFAKSAIEDPDVEKYVEDFRGEERNLWRHCIDLEFDQSERDDVMSKIRDYDKALFGDWRMRSVDPGVSIDASGATSFPPQQPKFKANHFEGRVRKNWELAWLSDEWLASRRATAERFADWLHYHVSHEAWGQREHASEDGDVEIAELLSVVWRVIDDRVDEKTGKPHRPKAIAQMAEAYRLLKKYGPQDAATRVAGDIEALGEKAHEAERRTLYGQAREYMENAFGFMMNGKYQDASDAYDKALGAAKSIDDPVLVWLAALGRRNAYVACANHRLAHGEEANAEQSKGKEYARAVKVYARHEGVVSWKNEADRRMNELRQKTIEDLRQTVRAKYERRSFSFSNTPYFAWRVFRDLEDRCAPPSVQKQYLLPLLDHGFGVPAEELRFRLRFGINKTRDWLGEVLDEPEESIEKQKVRDQAVVKVWRDAWRTEGSTDVALVACLETLPPLLKVLDAADAEIPQELLDKASAPGYAVKAIGSDIAKAWHVYACSLRDEKSYRRFREFYEKLDDRSAEDELARRMGRLPWYAWIVCGVATPAELVDWLCGRSALGKESRRRSDSGAAQGVGEAILNVVGNAIDANERLPAVSWAAIATWCNDVVMREWPDEYDIDWLVPVLALVAEHGTQTDDRDDNEPWLQVERSALKKIGNAWRRISEMDRERIDMSLALSVAWCLASVPMETSLRDEWSDLMEQVWKWLVDHWAKVKDHLANNPFSAPQCVWFISSIIEQDFRSHRVEANAKLLEVWHVSSTIPPAVYRILDPSFWSSESWRQLVDKLREGLGGARGEFPASWRIAISSLLRNALRHHKKPLDESLSFLVEHTLMLVANEDTFVANHAAYTAVSYAEICTEADERWVDSVTRTLDAMAKDVRLSVRQGAAFGAARLRHLAQSQRIRTHAERIYGELERDTYLIIKTQLRIGEEEVKAYWRRTSTEPSAS